MILAVSEMGHPLPSCTSQNQKANLELSHRIRKSHNYWIKRDHQAQTVSFKTSIILEAVMGQGLSPQRGNSATVIKVHL